MSIKGLAELNETASLFRFVEKAGPHSVGLRVVEQYDYSRVFRPLTDELGRPFAGERARPLQTLIWYPAKSTGASVMSVGDYTRLWATETSFGRPKMSARAQEWISGMSPTLEHRMWAVRDAEEARGRFPVFIYAPSFSSVSWENADLCEYLASHGFVVLATASLGATGRNMTADLSGIGAQAADISFLVGHARTLAQADVSKVAVGGFSWGGLSNVFAAARDNRIRALVALDGSIRYWPGLVRQATDVQPRRMTVPLISLSKGEWTLDEQARYLSHAQMDGPNVLNAWTHGDLFNVHMLGMTHREYSSMFQRNEDVWKDFHDPGFPDRQKADYGREHGIPAYAWVARYTLKFLDAYLNGDSSAMDYLRKTPAENSAPKHFMEVSYRAARGVPASLEAFREETGRRGFDCVEDVYAEMQKQDADFKLEEGAVNDWAEELINHNHLPQAIALLSLGVRMYPNSCAAHSNLARARQLSGQIQAAIAGYRKSLEINEAHAEARRRLRELEGANTEQDRIADEVELL